MPGKNTSDNLIKDLNSYPFSINADESTSNGNKKVFTILVFYFNPNKSIITVSYLSSFEVKSVDAKSIMSHIQNVFKEFCIPWHNLVSCLFDSCNIMRGKHNGVEQRCKELQPKLLDIDGLLSAKSTENV